MLRFIYEALKSFRKAFSRYDSWLLFTILILGVIGSTEIIGVSSFCRFWLLDDSGYHAFLRFFRSKAWSLTSIEAHWSEWVLSQNETVVVGQRSVLLGDHTQVPKDGVRMPGVVTLHQDSETQSKPSYFRGQFWGAIGLLVGSLQSPFCLPLAFQLHQGRKQIGEAVTDEKQRSTLGERLVTMAINWSLKHQRPTSLVLDAFFASKTVFKLANSVWSLKLKAPLVSIIVRAKKNYVAYFQVALPKHKKRGRPGKYGTKIKLMECFDHLHLFEKKQVKVYGNLEEVSIMVENLLWKPTASLVRFVFAITSRGPIVLMCSDLNQDPVVALELYCARVRIETMFDSIKNVFYAFRFRFWTKALPKTSRKPTKNKNLKVPHAQGLKAVQGAWNAQERFVTLAMIAQGLLQMTAIKKTQHVWRKSHTFLRTQSRELPSEKTVKQLVAPLIVQNFLNLASGGIMREIRVHLFGKNTLPSGPLEQAFPENGCA